MRSMMRTITMKTTLSNRLVRTAGREGRKGMAGRQELRHNIRIHGMG